MTRMAQAAALASRAAAEFDLSEPLGIAELLNETWARTRKPLC